MENVNTMTGDNMRKVNGIRIFFVLTVLLGIGCYQIANWTDRSVPKEQMATEESVSEENIITETEQTAPVNQTIDYKYVIVEEEDYLTVYFADRETVYEYTDIRYSDLEDSLRQKIRKGYCIPDDETLFGFLENYSS